MLTSIRGIVAASFATGLALSAAPAFAETSAPENEFDLAAVEAAADVTVDVADLEAATPVVDYASVNRAGDESSVEISGNVALASEYRFRGIDLSGGDIAIQGGIDLTHSSGFYVGTWGSSLDEDTVGYGHTELDVYAGFSGELTEGVSFDIGALAYLYPNAGAGDYDYIEAYGSVGFSIGPAESTLGIAYAPKQDSLGGTDNFYIYYDLSLGVPGTPFTATGHVGYTDGFLTFTNDGKAFDWSIGVETPLYGPVSFGVAYVGAEDDILPGNYDFADDALVFTLSASI
ncbi:TorF family putative porin [Altererythrobacter litoralis]|uniref:TorF family putative porin n=1 Tax=Altererythrobacter litoralis TaxID=3113904 RepID=A0ABU7GGU3_9SPHN|nr:TorF family putative porin [Erythrobacteraceae bacterium 1XM1-14]